jgi:integrase
MVQQDELRIVPFVNPSGAVVHRLTGWDKAGKRVRRNFKSFAEAVAERQRLEADLMNAEKPSPVPNTRLTQAQINEAEAAFQLLGGRSILLAVQFFNEHYKEPLQKITAHGAYEAFIKAKREEKKLRPRAIKNLESRVGTFIKRQPENLCVHEIPEPTVQEYVFKVGISARTATNNLYALNNFFRFCQKRRWVQSNPLANAERPRNDDKTPEILSVETVQNLFEQARRYKKGRMIPYLTLATFGAIRPAEIERLSWEKVCLKQKHVIIDGEAGKKRKRRVVELSKNAVAWLKQHADKKTPLVGVNWRRDFDRVRLLAGFGTPTDKHPKLKLWTDDVLRHTGITHKLNESGSDERTALWAGNSASTIHDHYKGIAAKGESKKFWSIAP